MDIGLREWLVVIGIIVIAAVLFDGWRRMSGNRNTLKFRLDRNLADLPDEDNPEIDGPARVVKKQEPSIDIDSADEIDFGLHADNDRVSSKNREAVQGALKLDDPQVPTLLNPFDDGEEAVATETETDAADSYYSCRRA